MCDTFLMHHSSILLKHICRKMISPLKLHNSSILDMCPQKILEKLHLDTHMTVLLKCLSFIFIFLAFAISVVGLFYHSLVWFVVQVQNIGKNTFLFSFCLLYDKLFIVFCLPLPQYSLAWWCCYSFQTLIERLLSMLQDPDYRVRLFLARRIGVLFQTWDGHGELFQDIWWGSKIFC